MMRNYSMKIKLIRYKNTIQIDSIQLMILSITKIITKNSHERSIPQFEYCQKGKEIKI